MKVSKFIAILKEANQDAEVILSSDEEGNEFRDAHISLNEYAVRYGREIETCSPDDVEAGEFDDEEVFDVVVIW